MDRPLGGRVNAAGLVAYSLHVSKETMTDPANPGNLACGMSGCFAQHVHLVSLLGS